LSWLNAWKRRTPKHPPYKEWIFSFGHLVNQFCFELFVKIWEWRPFEHYFLSPKQGLGVFRCHRFYVKIKRNSPWKNRSLGIKEMWWTIPSVQHFSKWLWLLGIGSNSFVIVIFSKVCVLYFYLFEMYISHFFICSPQDFSFLLFLLVLLLLIVEWIHHVLRLMLVG
jgi:hypothetical protein